MVLTSLRLLFLELCELLKGASFVCAVCVLL